MSLAKSPHRKNPQPPSYASSPQPLIKPQSITIFLIIFVMDRTLQGATHTNYINRRLVTNPNARAVRISIENNDSRLLARADISKSRTAKPKVAASISRASTSFMVSILFLHWAWWEYLIVRTISSCSIRLPRIRTNWRKKKGISWDLELEK